MSKSKAFCLLSAGFALGVWLASSTGTSAVPWYLLLVFGAVLFSLSVRGTSLRLAVAGACLVAVSLGALRLTMSEQPSEFAETLGKRQGFEAVIVEDVDVRADRQLLTVRPDNHRQLLLLTTQKGTGYAYGDRLYVEGKVTVPKVSEDFDYRKYLERFGVYGTVYYPKTLVLEAGHGNPLKAFVLSAKRAFVGRLSEVLEEPHSSLLGGILLGARRTLPEDTTEAFRRTGLSHIVAVSGFNISIIVAALAYLARWLGRRWSLGVSALAILGFAVATGASASVVRASLMGVLLLVALTVGRQYAQVPALLCAALLMLLENPRILFWDVGFQLSFLATLGILTFGVELERLGRSWPSFFGLKSVLFVTLSATLPTLPAVLYHFGTLSLVSLPANLLVLPVLPPIMLLGLLSVLPVIGPGFAYVAGLLLSYVLSVVDRLSGLPFAATHVPLPAWGVGLSFLLLTVCYVWLGEVKRAVEGPKLSVVDYLR